MTCQELTERVTDRLEDGLDGSAVRAFEAHLAGCRDCATFVRQVRATVALLRRLGVSGAPARGAARLLHLPSRRR